MQFFEFQELEYSVAVVSLQVQTFMQTPHVLADDQWCKHEPT